MKDRLVAHRRMTGCRLWMCPVSQAHSQCGLEILPARLRCLHINATSL